MELVNECVCVLLVHEMLQTLDVPLVVLDALAHGRDVVCEGGSLSSALRLDLFAALRVVLKASLEQL